MWKIVYENERNGVSNTRHILAGCRECVLIQKMQTYSSEYVQGILKSEENFLTKPICKMQLTNSRLYMITNVNVLDSFQFDSKVCFFSSLSFSLCLVESLLPCQKFRYDCVSSLILHIELITALLFCQ